MFYFLILVFSFAKLPVACRISFFFFFYKVRNPTDFTRTQRNVYCIRNCIQHKSNNKQHTQLQKRKAYMEYYTRLLKILIKYISQARKHLIGPCTEGPQISRGLIEYRARCQESPKLDYVDGTKISHNNQIKPAR